MKKTHMIAMGLMLYLLAACSQDYPVPVQAGHSSTFEVTFKLKLENISDKSSLPSAFSSGVWLVDEQKSLFVSGQAASPALEQLAEAGQIAAYETLIAAMQPLPKHGFWNQPLLPGGQTEWSFKGRPGQKLSFVTMLNESNDVFLAPEAGQLVLFDQKNEPVSGDLTALIRLWDAGTERNQPAGQGADQGARQKTSNQGAAEQGTVRLLPASEGYPETAQLLRIRIENDDVHTETHGHAH